MAKRIYNLVLFYTCIVLAVVSFIKLDIDNTKILLLLSLILSNRVDIQELEDKEG